jgi:hypothetical protein
MSQSTDLEWLVVEQASGRGADGGEGARGGGRNEHGIVEFFAEAS